MKPLSVPALALLFVLAALISSASAFLYPGYEYIGEFGSLGSGTGQFSYPSDVAIYPDPTLSPGYRVYIADTGHNRVSEWTMTTSGGYEGTPSWSHFLVWGSAGSGDFQFNGPRGIDMDSGGNVYVADTGNNRIRKYTVNGASVTWNSGWEGTTDGLWKSPFGVAVDGASLVIDGSGLLVTGTRKNVYVADSFNNRVQQIRDSDGWYVGKWGSTGSGNANMDAPRALAYDGDNDIVYLADTNNHRVMKYSGSGTFLRSWGGYGSGTGQFSYPAGIAVDWAGNVYIADTGNNRIQKFTPNGVLMAVWGSHGSGAGQLNDPRGIAVDSMGRVYVADTNNHRVEVFGIDLPSSLDYSEYVTLVGNQAGGGCGLFSVIHSADILKEMECLYTPDLSYAYDEYVFNSGGFASGNHTIVPYDPALNDNIADLVKYGSAPESTYPTNYDKLGWMNEYRDLHPPSPAAFAEGINYRLAPEVPDWTAKGTATLGYTRLQLALAGPLLCSNLYANEGAGEGHVICLIGYDDNTGRIKFVDSSTWQYIHPGIKEETYSNYNDRLDKAVFYLTVKAMKNAPTPLFQPYVARIDVGHQVSRRYLVVEVGIGDETPVLVWDRNNQVNMTDDIANGPVPDLVIDVPLPSYAAAYWPPSEANPWYLKVMNTDPAHPAWIDGFTLAERTVAPQGFEVTPYPWDSSRISVPAGSGAVVRVTVSPTAPVITAISPKSRKAGSSAFRMTVSGDKFLEGCTVFVNGAPRKTSYISGTKVRAKIPAQDLKTAGKKKITVRNPGTVSTTSNRKSFTVT